jgi:hypothetical protein
MQSDGRKGRDTYLRGCTRCFGSLDADESIYLLLANLHRPRGPCSQAAVDGWDASVACAHVSLQMACAVNGIHSSRFNCYRIPAGCLVTVLPPWVHAARRRIWPFDHAPGASDAYGMRSQHLFIFENGFSRENSSICFVGAGNLVACRQGWWSKVTAMCKGANRGLHASKPILSR